ncbi:MAG TPA: helicase-related protein [Dehalococcoidia bacterium]|nr:helicase-related protein [Dehalococcoidia bacterium]
MDNAGEWIRRIRRELGLTQSQLAEKLGVTPVTVSRWENGQSAPGRLAQRALLALVAAYPDSAPGPSVVREQPVPYSVPEAPAVPDFRSDGRMLRAFVEGERLRFGHLFSPGFGREISLIDPLPHQIIAVYDVMLPQPRLRLLLADDAGAGKTIMSGLYFREMLCRHLIRRILVVCPAGLVGNWKREMSNLFSLRFREVTGPDCAHDNPFAGPNSDLVVISVDTLTSDRVWARLAADDTPPYDLAVFDEAHKLSAFRNADGTFDTTDRYKVAEQIAGAPPFQEWRGRPRLPWHAHHLLLLTATPHMGKDFPYFALWRLLEPDLLPTPETLEAAEPEFRRSHFIRRTKEQMVRLDGSRIYPDRESNTVSYDLSPKEQELYDELTSYVRSQYNRARVLNRSAARLAMSVLQRRAASSTLAILRSLERRLARLDQHIAAFLAGQLTDRSFAARQRTLAVQDPEEEWTSDEEASVDGRERRDVAEDEAMAATAASNLAELEAERMEVERLLALAREVYEARQESKFEKLREVVQDPRFRGEKLLIFTEHRDTMEFLLARLEAIGFAGEVASIHGGMPYAEREAQIEAFRTRCRLMVATDAAGEGVNLQFCWIMVNYDIPWNPARIEQRFGRIHRYKQTHDPVVLVNLVAGKTREGRVLRTLLEKLERIRRELTSDKVFDVIGRQFQNVSLSEIIMRAVVEDPEAAAAEAANVVSAERVRMVEEADRHLRADPGDVASQLPALRARMEADHLQRLLPGYLRHYFAASAPFLGVAIEGDLNGRFHLRDLPLPLELALVEATEGRPRPLTVTKPSPDEEPDVLFVRPGEPFFEAYRAYFAERFGHEALRGAAFVDPAADEPYLYHLARVTVVRAADPEFPDAFPDEEVRDIRLVALRQRLSDRTIEPCDVGQPMVLRHASSVPPLALPAMSDVEACLEEARAYVDERVAGPAANRLADGLRAAVPRRQTFLRASFAYQEAELMTARRRLRERVERGDAAAARELDAVRQRQRALAEEKERRLRALEREPELVRVGEVRFLAHALVLPSSDPEERERHDREIEAIAVRVARAYEESFGATVIDVSDPRQKAGYDLLSRRPDGETRCIEVKGRRGVGDVELTENELAKAANLRDTYWLYVVYDCAAMNPRLLRVRDPFGRLLFKARGGVIIGEQAVFEAAEG